MGLNIQIGTFAGVCQRYAQPLPELRSPQWLGIQMHGTHRDLALGQEPEEACHVIRIRVGDKYRVDLANVSLLQKLEQRVARASIDDEGPLLIVEHSAVAVADVEDGQLRQGSPQAPDPAPVRTPERKDLLPFPRRCSLWRISTRPE